MTIENKLDGVRLCVQDIGDSHDFSVLLEALREVNAHQMPSIAAYEKNLREEFCKGNYTPLQVNKIALLRSAQRVAERISGRIQFNPTDEGIYRVYDHLDYYSTHIHGD